MKIHLGLFLWIRYFETVRGFMNIPQSQEFHWNFVVFFFWGGVTGKEGFLHGNRLGHKDFASDFFFGLDTNQPRNLPVGFHHVHWSLILRWTWGWGGGFFHGVGALGLGHTQTCERPTEVEHFRRCPKNLRWMERKDGERTSFREESDK